MTENIKTAQDTKSFDEHVDQALELATRGSARRLLAAPAEQLSIPEKTRSAADYQSIGKKFLAGVGIAGAAWLGFGAANSILSEPGVTVSEERKDYIVQPGDGLWSITGQIENSDSADKRLLVEELENYSANKEALEDGLQPGEVISHPSRVE